MSILIAYSSKHGDTKECVTRLSKALGELSHTLCNLDKETPSIEEYDVVILGSPVYFGNLRPSVRKFIKEHQEKLTEKKLGLFLVGGLAHEAEFYQDALFPKELREKAFQRIYFGGTLTKTGRSFWERMLIRSMRSSIMESEMEEGEYTMTLPGILPENIDRMATFIREQLR